MTQSNKCDNVARNKMNIYIYIYIYVYIHISYKHIFYVHIFIYICMHIYGNDVNICTYMHI